MAFISVHEKVDVGVAFSTSFLGKIETIWFVDVISIGNVEMIYVLMASLATD